MIKRLFVNTFFSSVIFTILLLMFSLLLFGLESLSDYLSFVFVYVFSLILYLVLGVPLTFFTFWIYDGIKLTVLKHILIQVTLLIFASLILYASFLRGLEKEHIDIWGSLGIAYLSVISSQIGYHFANRKISNRT